uniref:Putative encapsulating protein for peroxidase n=1 Tax=viral metagenome TaxID=1070528 RepID=A0A6M3XTG4_9ZZZZ
MNKFRDVGRDEPLTLEQGQFILDRVVFAARRELIGRRLLPIRKIDAGTATFGYDTLTEAANAAIDIAWPGRETLDIVNLVRSTVAVPTIHKEFLINKLDLAASRQTGTPLNTTTAESAGYKVGLEEDALVILGYARDGVNYDINGLYNAAGNSDAVARDWGTATNIPISINTSVSKLMEDNIFPPYNLCLYPDQYNEAAVFVANTAVPYLTWIKERIGGEIYPTATIKAGTGMMTKANPIGMFEYVVAEDFNVETEVQSKRQGSGLFGRVYVRGLPIVYDANAICTMTAI